MRTNLALVETRPARAKEPRKKRDRRAKAIFFGAHHAQGAAEGRLYVAFTIVDGPNGQEQWLADFSVGAAQVGWDTGGACVFDDANAYLASITRAVPPGESVRLSRRLARRLRKKAIEAILQERKRELAELEKLFKKYTRS